MLIYHSDGKQLENVTVLSLSGVPVSDRVVINNAIVTENCPHSGSTSEFVTVQTA